MPDRKSDLLADSLLLLELALAVGRFHKYGLEQRCQEFLRILMARKNLSYGAVWIRSRALHRNADDRTVRLIAALPQSRRGMQEVSTSHRSMAVLEENRVQVVRDTDSDFRGQVLETNIDAGSFVSFRLSDIGVLRLYSTKTAGFSTREINQLLGVVETFAISIEAALSQRLLEEEARERERIEEEVRTRDAWLRAILENAPMQITLKDTEGRILAVSRNVSEYIDVVAEDCIGLRTADLVPAKIAEIYNKADQEVLATGRTIQQETVEELGGTTQFYLNAKFPLKDQDGQILGVCSLTSDITDMKRAEKDLLKAQRMEAVGRLTGGVAHDFNNLLMVIHGNAEMLAKLDERSGRFSKRILRAAARGSELTQRLLAFARQQPLHPSTIDLRALVSETSELLIRTLGETIDIGTRTAPDLWTASADPGQVENALLNLALNARDAMPGGGKLTIEGGNARFDEADAADHPEAKPGDYVFLAVSDEGTGMTADVGARAFEPFFTTKEVGEGSGLGLSMVYGFAKQSGGHVSIYSEEGQGTTVKLFLPRGGDWARDTSDEPQAALPRGSGESVLVIEDNPDVRAVAVTMLQDLGYGVIEVGDALAADQVLEAGRAVDLVLSDVVLPGGISGLDFAQSARQSFPGLKIIFMSGHPAEAIKRNGFPDQKTVLLNKPFGHEQLAKALRGALDSAGCGPARD